MAINFDIIISVENLISYSNDLILKYGIFIYLEKWNIEKHFYYSEINEINFDTKKYLDRQYRTIFFSSKQMDIKQKTDFYSDIFSKYLVELKGGRENDEEIELIQMRIVSKNPSIQIKSFYEELQRKVKKDDRFGRGVKWGVHEYKTIFYDKYLGNKKIWGDFSKKDYQLIV